jgi:hypothetical protein
MQAREITLRVMALGVLLVGATLAHAQGSCTFTDETGKTVTWKNCKPPEEASPQNAPGAPAAPGTNTPSAPSSSVPPAKSFPFPGEPPAPATTQAPATPAAGDNNAPASKRFPFPGETPAPVDNNGNPLHDAGSSGDSTSGSGSSSSSSSSSEDPSAGPLGEDDDAAAKAAAERKAERKRKASTVPQTPSEREEEDLNVAEFYQNDRNFKGAYERATDAVSIASDDPNAHFALAEAARRLGKLDEAEKHYKTCLTLDPVPKVKKATQAALKQMAGG